MYRQTITIRTSLPKAAMNKLLLTIVISGVLLCACNSKDTVKTEVFLPALRASSIENQDSVAWYIETYGEANKSLAGQYAKKSASLEDEFSAKAIWNLKRAITLHPTKKYYQELVALLMKAGQYEEAVRVSGILVSADQKKNAAGEWGSYYIFDKPNIDDFYNFLICSFVSGNAYELTMGIYGALSLDLDTKEIRARLEKDPRFTLKPGTPEYDNFALCFLTEAEIETYCNDPRNFEKFLSKMNSLKEPFLLSQRDITHFNYNEFNGMGNNSMDGYSMTNVEANFLAEVKASPGLWLQYNMLGKKQLNENVWVICYAVDTSAIACPVEMRNIYINMMTYTSKGDLIDSKIIAWQAPYTAATALFANNEVRITEYKREWKKPFERYEFDNDLKLTEQTGERTLSIAADGKILAGEVLPVN